MLKQTFTKAGIAGACILAAGLISTAARAAGPELVVNGDFETGTFTGWTASSTAGNDSFFGVDDAGPQNGLYAAYFGAFSPSDMITQTLATTAGARYTLSFLLDSSSTRGAPAAFVGMFGNSTFINLTDADANFDFKPFSFQVTAASASTQLSFSAFNHNDAYRLDDVSVTAVPEPATSALLALGLAAVGIAARRGSRPA